VRIEENAGRREESGGSGRTTIANGVGSPGADGATTGDGLDYTAGGDHFADESAAGISDKNIQIRIDEQLLGCGQNGGGSGAAISVGVRLAGATGSTSGDRADDTRGIDLANSAQVTVRDVGVLMSIHKKTGDGTEACVDGGSSIAIVDQRKDIAIAVVTRDSRQITGGIDLKNQATVKPRRGIGSNIKVAARVLEDCRGSADSHRECLHIVGNAARNRFDGAEGLRGSERSNESEKSNKEEEFS